LIKTDDVAAEATGRPAILAGVADLAPPMIVVRVDLVALGVVALGVVALDVVALDVVALDWAEPGPTRPKE
jgi:hypothetical protein